ncbi:MAG TPA: 23S rRNA (pseudouridine(1915)-N(3))-methyltransferase RlmH [Limnochordales bacterium]
MLRLWVVAVGPLRHPGMAQAAAEYLRRLQRMPQVSLQVMEVRPARGDERRPEQVLQEEGRRLMAAAIPENSVRVALAVEGEALDSLQWSRWLKEMAWRDVPVAFFVGGAWGLSGDVLGWCQRRVSLSPLTMSHELSRLVLLEQLYRVAATLAGIPYPK